MNPPTNKYATRSKTGRDFKVYRNEYLVGQHVAVHDLVIFVNCRDVSYALYTKSGSEYY
jgi:hypothetical protein